MDTPPLALIGRFSFIKHSKNLLVPFAKNGLRIGKENTDMDATKKILVFSSNNFSDPNKRGSLDTRLIIQGRVTI